MYLKKIKVYDMVFIVLAVVVIIVGILIPKSGEFALLDEGFDIAFFWVATIYISTKFIKAWKNIAIKAKLIAVLMITSFVVFSCFVTKDLIVDVVVGAKTIDLINVQTYEYRNTSSSSSKHYYMQGKDENNNSMRLEISNEEYYYLKNSNRVRVEYYENTKRVFSVKNI